MLESLLTVLSVLVIAALLYALVIWWPRAKTPFDETVDEPFRRVKFPKGTTITCPKCSNILGVAKEDVFSGDRMASCKWSGAKRRSIPKCPDDGTLYVRTNFDFVDQLHTDKGWVG